MHSLGGGVAGQGGRVVVGQLLKVVGFMNGTIGRLFTILTSIYFLSTKCRTMYALHAELYACILPR